MPFAIRVPKVFASLTLVALAACTAPDSSPTALAPSDEPAAAKPTASPYTYQELPTLSGYREIQAWDVNNQRVVVGTAADETAKRGFIVLDGQLVTLTQSGDSQAIGVSNGDPMYVVGALIVDDVWRAARWTVTGGSIDAPALGPVNSSVSKVNDLGDAVGSNYIWRLDNSVIQVPYPGDYSFMSGSNINDAGVTLFNAWGSPTTPERAFVRLTDGTMVRLDPPAGREAFTTTASGLNEPDGNGVVLVAGTIRDGGSRYPARWALNVDMATPQATVFVDSRSGFASDVSTAGTRVGGSGGWETDAYAWRLDGTKFKLAAPRGAQDASAYSISDNGKYAAGSYYDGRQARRALLWSGNGP